eukprot:jgi/Mesen1/4582/ME000232S03839
MQRSRQLFMDWPYLAVALLHAARALLEEAWLEQTYALLQNPEMSSNGEALGFGTSLLFTSLFAIRLAATKKPFPAGPLLALSAAATAVYASAYFT